MAQSDYKTVIKIEGETKSAEAGISRVKGAFISLKTTLLGVRSAISSVMKAFGVFYLAFEGIKAAYTNVKKLIGLLKEYYTAAERATLASNISNAVYETNRLVESQKNLNNLLKEQLTIASRTASLREMWQSGSKSFADEQRNVNRAVELAGVTDPRQRQKLEDRYALEDEALKRAETKQNLSDRIGKLSAEADAFSASAAKARDIRAQAEKQYDAERSIQAQQEELGATDEDREASKKRIEALVATKVAAYKEQKVFEEEAEYRRQQISVLEQQLKAFEKLGTSAQQVQEAAWKKIDAADAEASKKLADKLQANEAADKWERDFANASPAEKINMLTEKENSARNRLNSLQSELDVEMGKSVAERDQARMAELRSGIESAQGEMFAARRHREGMAEEAAAASARQSISLGGGSRLNAMGLGAGSGVQRIQEQMANSLRDLVRLGHDQLTALKDIKNEDDGATYQ